MLNSLWHRNFEKKWTTEIDTQPQMLTSWIFGPKIPRITGFSEFNDLSNFPILLIFRYPIKFLAETSFFGRKFLFDLKIFTTNFFPTVPIRFRGTSIFCEAFLKCMNHDFWNSRVMIPSKTESTKNLSPAGCCRCQSSLSCRVNFSLALPSTQNLPHHPSCQFVLSCSSN